ETRELHSSVRRLLIVAREQHNEVSRVLNSLVHLLDKVCSNRNIVILRANPIAIFLENVGDLLSNGGHRAATAQEEIVSLTGTAWHGRWGRRVHSSTSELSRGGTWGQRREVPSLYTRRILKGLAFGPCGPTAFAAVPFIKSYRAPSIGST